MKDLLYSKNEQSPPSSYQSLEFEAGIFAILGIAVVFALIIGMFLLI